jgi:hypothetical protein
MTIANFSLEQDAMRIFRTASRLSRCTFLIFSDVCQPIRFSTEKTSRTVLIEVLLLTPLPSMSASTLLNGLRLTQSLETQFVASD